MNNKTKIIKFLDRVTNSKKDGVVNKFIDAIRSSNISIVFEDMPVRYIAQSTCRTIQISSKIANEVSEVDLAYILLHEFYHVIEEVSMPLCIDTRTRQYERADQFADKILRMVFNKTTKSKYTYPQK